MASLLSLHLFNFSPFCSLYKYFAFLVYSHYFLFDALLAGIVSCPLWVVGAGNTPGVRVVSCSSAHRLADSRVFSIHNRDNVVLFLPLQLGCLWVLPVALARACSAGSEWGAAQCTSSVSCGSDEHVGSASVASVVVPGSCFSSFVDCVS